MQRLILFLVALPGRTLRIAAVGQPVRAATGLREWMRFPNRDAADRDHEAQNQALHDHLPVRVS